MKNILLILFTVAIVGCSTNSEPPVVINADLDGDRKPSGKVNQDWKEPIYDVVKEPGRIDPSGTYYRKEHNTVVEIREDKVQKAPY